MSNNRNSNDQQPPPGKAAIPRLNRPTATPPPPPIVRRNPPVLAMRPLPPTEPTVDPRAPAAFPAPSRPVFDRHGNVAHPGWPVRDERPGEQRVTYDRVGKMNPPQMPPEYYGLPAPVPEEWHEGAYKRGQGVLRVNDAGEYERYIGKAVGKTLPAPGGAGAYPSSGSAYGKFTRQEKGKPPEQRTFDQATREKSTSSSEDRS